MAPYRRLALGGPAQRQRPWGTRRPVRGTRFAPAERKFDEHDAQPMLGLIIAVPLGLACWGVIGGLALGVSSLLG